MSKKKTVRKRKPRAWLLKLGDEVLQEGELVERVRPLVAGRASRLPIGDVLTALGVPEAQRRRSEYAVSMALRDLGYRQVRTRVAGARVRFWEIPSACFHARYPLCGCTPDMRRAAIGASCAPEATRRP